MAVHATHQPQDKCGGAAEDNYGPYDSRNKLEYVDDRLGEAIHLFVEWRQIGEFATVAVISFAAENVELANGMSFVLDGQSLGVAVKGELINGRRAAPSYAFPA